MSDAKRELARAWAWREARGIFTETEAVRVFHGPGEGTGARRSWAVDRFKNHFWITYWEGGSSSPGRGGAADDAVAEGFVGFLKEQGAESIVLLGRPEQGVPAHPVVMHGAPPQGRFVVSERGLKFLIQLTESRHPGLFLDHAPLRSWLRARARGWRVLNTFSYTGSLSVAAGAGGAAHVTTLDLSKPTIAWAEDNWRENGLPQESGRFIFGDVFEWLPRLKREGQAYECLILDPPSFSRGKKGNFSTSKDLTRLHELALDLLADGGALVTSINSANVAWAKYEADVLAAARSRRLELEVLWRIDQPETFPSPLGSAPERYLKGWALRVRRPG